MKSAAVGFRVHSGWTSLVAVAVEKEKPIVLARHRPHLVSTFSYTFRQPYHTAARMSVEDAATFLEGLRDEARRLAVAALKSARADVAQQGYQLTRAALLTASGRPLPELARILTSHSLIHSADGEFFREAILSGGAQCRLAVTMTKDRELLAAASSKLHRKPATLLKLLTALGKPLGGPWTQDEKFATLVAWLQLVSAK
jgi:hypothetical protein